MRIILFLILAIFLIPSVHSLALGVSNPDLNFENGARSAILEKKLLVSVDSSDLIEGYVEGLGEFSSWINYSKFYVQKGSPSYAGVILKIPKDTPNGNYSGQIRLVALKSYDNLGNENRVFSGIILPFYVEVNGVEIKECAIISTVSDSEEGLPILLKAELSNVGNIDFVADLNVKFDSLDYPFNKSFNVDLNPLQTIELSELIDNKFSTGTYFASVYSLVCDYTEIFEINILAKGSLSGSGKVNSITHEEETTTGKSSSISAEFANTGETILNARLVVDVYKDGSFVKSIQSEQVFVSPGEVKYLLTPFDEDADGVYELVSRVIYNNKVTEYKTSYLTVKNSSSSLLTYLVLGIIIIVLLILIKKRYKDKPSL